MKKIHETPAPLTSQQETSWRQTRNAVLVGIPLFPLAIGIVSGSPELALGGPLIAGSLEFSVMAAFGILTRLADQQSSGDSATR